MSDDISFLLDSAGKPIFDGKRVLIRCNSSQEMMYAPYAVDEDRFVIRADLGVPVVSIDDDNVGGAAALTTDSTVTDVAACAVGCTSSSSSHSQPSELQYRQLGLQCGSSKLPRSRPDPFHSSNKIGPAYIKSVVKPNIAKAKISPLKKKENFMSPLKPQITKRVGLSKCSVGVSLPKKPGQFHNSMRVIGDMVLAWSMGNAPTVTAPTVTAPTVTAPTVTASTGTRTTQARPGGHETTKTKSSTMVDDILEEFLQFPDTQDSTQPDLLRVPAVDNINHELRLREIYKDNIRFEQELLAKDDTSSINSAPLGQTSALTDISVGCNPAVADNRSSDDHPEPAIWNKEDTLKLISLYEQMKQQFESNNVKKIVLWSQIARKLTPFTSRQCANRWKYLRSCYLKKLDNMSSGNVGKRRIVFDYFGEMDSILRKSHRLKPLSPASLMRGEKNIPSKLTAGHRGSASGYKSGISDESELVPRSPSVNGSRSHSLMSWTTQAKTTTTQESLDPATSTLIARPLKMRLNRERKEWMEKSLHELKKIADEISMIARSFNQDRS